MAPVGARERAATRGTRRGLDLTRAIGSEIRIARRRLGLRLVDVARQVGISASELSRIERGRAEWVSMLVLAEACAVVGLDLVARVYPGPRPLRDAHHGRMLTRFHGRIHPALGWGTEVPLPTPGDQRAWDALVRGSDWRYGIEAELNPIDGQALLRRLALKQRDGMVGGVILLMPDTRQTRLFRREFADLLAVQFPVRGSLALTRLAAGHDPGGSAMVVL